MWRPAIARFGTLLALVACGGSRPAGPLEHHGGSAPPIAGNYACSIEDEGYRYEPFHCVIRDQGGKLWLRKLDGSQRFEGEVRETGKGLAFAGRFYCPFGDCTQELHGVFAPSADGGMKGTFSDAKFVVWLQPAPAGPAYGGAVYGGESYGGSGYGGPARNP
jgi:hypothetical protein